MHLALLPALARAALDAFRQAFEAKVSWGAGQTGRFACAGTRLELGPPRPLACGAQLELAIRLPGLVLVETLGTIYTSSNPTTPPQPLQQQPP